MSEQSSRPSWRLHFATWVALVLVGGVMFHKQCYVNDYDPSYVSFGDPFILSFGWLVTFVSCPERQGLHVWNRNYGANVIPPWWHEWLWNAETNKAVNFSPPNLVIDVAVSLLVIFGAAFTIERQFPHHAFRLRFSLKFLIAMTAWVAVCVYRIKDEDGLFWGHSVINQMASFTYIIALGLCCFAAVDLIGVAFNRATKRRK